MKQERQFNIRLELFEPDRLERCWCDLEKRACPNFFLSWYWVKSWIEAFAPDLKVVEITLDGELVGLGLLTLSTEVRHKVIQSRVLRLGQTGEADKDQIWIEYNGLLVDSRYAKVIPESFMEFMLTLDDWDEFLIGASSVSTLNAFQHRALTPVTRWESSAFGVDLNAIRANSKDFLSSLSSNTRYQIKRSIKKYRAQGKFEFEVLSEIDTFKSVWGRIGDLHMQRWGDQSGFRNPNFVSFHEALIRNAQLHKAIEFCILKLNNDIVGCLYNFILKGRVYFYLSGLEYQEDRAIKPGMVLHAMAIQSYLERGFEYYDFMGGDAQYKRSLSNAGSNLMMLSFQRPRMKLRIEQHLRGLKNSLSTFGLLKD